ncbi:transposase, partial [Catenibacterium mitsuokai]|uniref:transposase n=1 Tax=Catenibacterium mitsuokai TaxID=100886 RepID=UPI0022E38FEA
YEAECIQRNLNTTNALALDLGINNLVTGVSSKGETFIIDGRRLEEDLSPLTSGSTRKMQDYSPSRINRTMAGSRPTDRRH